MLQRRGLVSHAPVKIAHALFVFIAVTQLLQYPLSKDHRRLARKASELQVASQLARPVVSSESYTRPKPTSESMASAPRRLFRCVITSAHELALVKFNALLLCNHIALNPGPVKTITCAACSKGLRSKQSFAECSGCLKWYHLKCFGPELESAKLCSVCATAVRIKVDQQVRAALITDYFYSKVAVKEFKIAHQNIRSIS